MIRPLVFYTSTAFISLIIGLSIFFLAPTGSLLRNSGGDFIVVIFLYTLFKSFFPNARNYLVAFFVLMWSIFLEILQFFEIPNLFNTEHALVKLILGTTFQWLDIFIYTLGLLLILVIDIMLTKPNNG